MPRILLPPREVGQGLIVGSRRYAIDANHASDPQNTGNAGNAENAGNTEITGNTRNTGDAGNTGNAPYASHSDYPCNPRDLSPENASRIKESPSSDFAYAPARTILVRIPDLGN